MTTDPRLVRLILEVKRRLRDDNLTQKNFADFCGVTTMTAYRWLSHRVAPHLAHITLMEAFTQAPIIRTKSWDEYLRLQAGHSTAAKTRQPTDPLPPNAFVQSDVHIDPETGAVVALPHEPNDPFPAPRATSVILRLAPEAIAPVPRRKKGEGPGRKGIRIDRRPIAVCTPENDAADNARTARLRVLAREQAERETATAPTPEPIKVWVDEAKEVDRLLQENHGGASANFSEIDDSGQDDADLEPIIDPNSDPMAELDDIMAILAKPDDSDDSSEDSDNGEA